MNNSIKKLLTVLGVPAEERDSRYCCPLHQRESFTLAFLENTILPCGYRVKCTDPKCGFDGTVFDLIAKVTDKARSEVMSMFLPEGMLHDTFIRSTHNRGHDRAVIEDYMIAMQNDKVLRNYLIDCKKGLMECNELRASLSKFGVQENYIRHMMCGKYDQLMPDGLGIDPPKAGKTENLICPYTCGGMVTGFVVVDPDNGFRNEVSVQADADKYGIFQEEAFVEDVVYDCPDELTAMLVRSKFLEFTDKPSGAMCFRTHEALSNLDDAVTVRMISSPDRLLSFTRSATYWMYLRDKKDVRVVELPRKIIGSTGVNLSKLLKVDVSLDDWLVDHLDKVNHKSGHVEVTKLVSAVGLRKKDKSDLMKLLKEAGHDDPLFLQAIRRAKLAGSIMQYDGIRIRRNATTYANVSRGNKVISNFVFFADTVTDDPQGKKVVIGRVKVDDPNIPPFPASFRTSELVTPYGSKVTEKLWGQAKEQGVNFPFSASMIQGGPTWFNVLTSFDDPEFKRSVAALGSQDEGTLSLPNVRIDFTAGTMSDGGYMYGVEPMAEAMYSEVRNVAAYDPEVLKVLLESDNPTAKRVCALLGHVVHQLVTSAMLGSKYVPRHLVLPYSVAEDTWYNVLGQLGCILGGNPRPVLVPSSATELNAVIKSNQQLETLPGIYLSRSEPNKKTLDWMFSSKNSIVIGVPSKGVIPLSREDVTYLMYDEEDSVGHKDLLNHEVMNSVRDALPHVLVHASGEVDVGIDTDPNVLPVHRGLRWLADFCEAKLPEIDFVISDYYSIAKRNGLELFAHAMAKEFAESQVEISETRGEYNHEGDRYIGYYRKEMVVFNTRRSIECLRKQGVEFNSTYLREQCIERGWMRSKQREDIPLSREFWDSYVKPLKSTVLTKTDLKLTLVS